MSKVEKVSMKKGFEVIGYINGEGNKMKEK